MWDFQPHTPLTLFSRQVGNEKSKQYRFIGIKSEAAHLPCEIADSGVIENLIPEQTEHMIPEITEHQKPERKYHYINAK